MMETGRTPNPETHCLACGRPKNSDPTAEKKMTEKPGWAYCSTLSSGSRCVCNPGVHEKNLLKLLDGNHQEYSDRLKKAEEGLERKHDLCDEAHIENIKKIEELQADIASRDSLIVKLMELANWLPCDCVNALNDAGQQCFKHQILGLMPEGIASEIDRLKERLSKYE